MKIELKNTDFKELYEFLDEITDKYPLAIKLWRLDGENIKRIILHSLKPQYEKAFLKYKDEKQKFNVGDKIQFNGGSETTDGKITKISRLSNGKFRYGVEYYYVGDINESGDDVWFKTTTYLTEKNIRKI